MGTHKSAQKVEGIHCLYVYMHTDTTCMPQSHVNFESIFEIFKGEVNLSNTFIFTYKHGLRFTHDISDVHPNFF